MRPEAEPAFRLFGMDQPVLEPLVEELAASEKLRAFAGMRGGAARVSEPLVPLLLAAYWRAHEPGRGLVALLPEDADARDVAEAVGWFVGPENVGLFLALTSGPVDPWPLVAAGAHYWAGLVVSACLLFVGAGAVLPAVSERSG